MREHFARHRDAEERVPQLGHRRTPGIGNGHELVNRAGRDDFLSRCEERRRRHAREHEKPLRRAVVRVGLNVAELNEDAVELDGGHDAFRRDVLVDQGRRGSWALNVVNGGDGRFDREHDRARARAWHIVADRDRQRPDGRRTGNDRAQREPVVVRHDITVRSIIEK